MSEQNKRKDRVLVVDDDDAVRSGLFWVLTEQYNVVQAASRSEANAFIDQQDIDVVISDLHLPPRVEDISEGLAIIEAARGIQPPVPVIVITGSDSRDAAIEAVRRGAYGFFQKPLDPSEIEHIVQQAVRMRRLEQEIFHLRSELSLIRGFSNLIGTSSSLQRTIKQARAVAATSATVLLVGENGTGKEVLARAIHEESQRADGPFVAVSCASLPESLIESELFGHEKGAFTSAIQSRKGRFELANGGTLFLDEIGELNLTMQVKLLRVLQERAFERVGGTRTLVVDIRLIAASNRDLEKDADAGTFRQDLFYRLNVVPLILPPLRDRKEDIPVLASHFAIKAAAKYAKPNPELDPKLIEALENYEWPGNVRELENLIERLVLLSNGPKLGLEFLPERMFLPSSLDQNTLEGAVTALKRQLVIKALQSEGGNRLAAAKRLAISRSYLHRLMTEFGLLRLTRPDVEVKSDARRSRWG
jgi:DNA-binding NtrC family response regulator